MNIKSREDYKKLISYLESGSKGQAFIDFQNRIIKTGKRIIGNETPFLRKLAKELLKNEYEGLFKYGNDNIFEITLLKGFILAGRKDNIFKELNELILTMDCWAEVDMILSSLKCVKYFESEAYDFFSGLLCSDKEFVIRSGVIGFMKYFLDEKYILDVFSLLNNIKCEYYYVDMAISWLISEYLVKNPQNAVKNMQKIIKNYQFNKFIINKSIQKARESKRISDETKRELNGLKVL